MHKIFLAVCSIIVTSFLMKSYRKIREKPETEEDKIERLCADARTTFNRMDGGLIDSLMQQMTPGRFM